MKPMNIMIPAKPTANEACRLKALKHYEVLDTVPDQALDDLTSLAAQICGAPIAMVSLVDESRQWFKAKVGIDTEETARAVGRVFKGEKPAGDLSETAGDYWTFRAREAGL